MFAGGGGGGGGGEGGGGVGGDQAAVSWSGGTGGGGVAVGAGPPLEPAGRERKLLRTCRRRVGPPVPKHAAQKEKPVHLVQRRNARERRRVQAVNVAFSRLSKVVPLETRWVATGRSAARARVR